MTASWFIRRGDKIGGPHTADQIKAWASEGKLLPTDELAQSQSGPWTPVFKLKIVERLPHRDTEKVHHVPAVAIRPEDNEPPAGPVFAIIRASSAAARVIALPVVSARKALSASSQRRYELKLERLRTEREVAALRREEIARMPRESIGPQASVQSLSAGQPIIVQNTIVQKVRQTSASSSMGGCGVGCLAMAILMAGLAFSMCAGFGSCIGTATNHSMK